MMKNSRTIYLEISIILVAILFTGCSKVSSNKLDSEETTQNQLQSSVDNVSKDALKNAGESLIATNMSGNLLEDGSPFQSSDYYEDYNEREVNYIQLNGSSIVFSGEGAFVSDNKISISKPGTYVIFGTLKDGQIIVEETSGGMVHLILKNATIHCESSAPIYIKEAGRAIISLAPGTKNILTDGLVEHDKKLSDPNATIYCVSDLTLNGAGSLVINAAYQNAISSKGILKIVEGDYEIFSVGHGIIGKEAVLIDASKITIASGGDGIRTNNDTEDSEGLIFINRGEFVITSEQDGMQADKRLVLQDGSYQITTGVSTGSAKKEDKKELINNKLIEITEYDNSKSANGLKSGEEILIGNGTFTLDSTDDAIHSDGNVSIDKAKIAIIADGDGIESNGSVTMTGGSLIIEGSSNNKNGVIVHNGVFEMNGGTLLQVGNSGLAMTPSITSKQKSILINLKETIEAETVLCLLEGEDRIPVMAYLPTKSYQSIVYSSPLLLEGKSYTLSTGGSTTPKEGTNISTPKTYEDGVDKANVTINGILTTYGEVKAPIKPPPKGTIE
jgi:hypothetical protein